MMNIVLTSCLFCLLAASLGAAEPYEALLRLSASCQNAASERSRGDEDPTKFSEFIKATDDAMQELVSAGYLIEEHLLMRAPDRMNGNERVQFEQQRMQLANEYAARYGFYAVTEMMGWEFRDQIKGGRFFRPDRDESKNFRLRVRLPEQALKKFKDSLSDYIIRTIPKTKIGEQGGAEQPATRSEAKSEGNEKPKPESEGRSR